MSAFTKPATSSTKHVYILRNAIMTPDKTILRSYSRWDYVSHLDAVSGETYSTDGGTYYERRSVNTVPYLDMTVTTADAFELQREAFVWGTYGKDGKQKKTYTALKDMSDDHIWNILLTQAHINGTYVEELFENELEYRIVNNIEIKE